MPHLKVLGRELLDSLRVLQAPGDPDIIDELVRIFSADSAACLAAADRALHASDATALGVAAHRLRGSAGLLGLQRLQRAAEDLERVANVGGPSEWTARLLLLRAALAEAHAALRELLIPRR